MDTACVDVCPVDCIHLYTGDDPNIPTNQLLIDPEVCIDCAVCEPECPWEAIYQDAEVPQEFQQSIEINARIAGQEEIETPHTSKPQPKAEEALTWRSPKFRQSSARGPRHLLQRQALLHVQGERSVRVHVLPLQWR
jgi:ferredoxin